MSQKHISLKSKAEIEAMAESGKILADLLLVLGERIKPGVYGDELEELALDFIKKHGATPSFLHYQVERGIEPFPAALCFSVNDEIVHGFPFGKIIKEGDIVSLDTGVKFGDFHADSAITVGAGKLSSVAQRLLEVTRQSLYEGIKEVRPGSRLGDVGHAIQAYAETEGFSVVRDLVGHGVGRSVHESPEVANYGRAGTGLKLFPGMVIAIEPMIDELGYEIKVDDDDWTIRTADGGLSAHFEHTVAVTDDGCRVLTLREGENII